MICTVTVCPPTAKAATPSWSDRHCSRFGREFYAAAFGSSILVGLVKPFILPLFPLQLTINERQPAAPNIPICPISLEWKAARGAFWGAHAPSRAIASPARTFGAAPKRTWHGVAVPRCLRRKVRDDKASSPGRRGDRSPDESENANTPRSKPQSPNFFGGRRSDNLLLLFQVPIPEHRNEGPLRASGCSSPVWQKK
jgi:hypothetical protein